MPWWVYQLIDDPVIHRDIEGIVRVPPFVPSDYVHWLYVYPLRLPGPGSQAPAPRPRLPAPSLLPAPVAPRLHQ